MSRCPRFYQKDDVRRVIFAVLIPATSNATMEGRSGWFIPLLRLHLLIVVVDTILALVILPLCLLGVLVRAQCVIITSGLTQVTCGVI
jgi:hypothetical protein